MVNKKSNEVNLKAALVRARSSIRKKYNKLYSNRAIHRSKLDETFAPITSSINRLMEHRPPLNVKTEVKEEKNEAEAEAENGYNDTNSVNGSKDIIFPDHISFESLNDHGLEEPATASNIEEDNNELAKLTRTPSLPNIPKNIYDDDITLSDDDIEMIDYSKNKSSRSTAVKRRTVDSDDDDMEHDYVGDARANKLYVVDRTVPVNTRNSRENKDRMKKWKTVEDLNELRQRAAKIKQEPVSPEDKIVYSPEDYNDMGKYKGTSGQRSKVVSSTPKTTTEFNEMVKTARRNRKITDDGESSKHGSKHGKQAQHKGSSLEKEFIPYNNNIAYEYFDDPNELCERLFLLISSKSAGNTNHDHEINSILEELRECGVIE